MRAKRMMSLTLAAGMLASSMGIIPAAADDTYTVKISYPCLVFQPSEAGTEQVEAELNAYLESIGEDVRIDLDPIDGANYTTTVDMELIGGEKMDIYLPLDGLGLAVAANKVISLNPYLEDQLADTVKTIGEDYLIPSTYDGEVYGIQTYRGNVMIYYWICDQEIFDATGFAAEDITNMRDLAPVLDKIKEQNPGVAAIAPSIGANNSGNSFLQTAILGARGDYEAVLIGSDGNTAIIGDDPMVVNVYETDYFKECAEIAYDWNQNGYVLQDAAVTTDAPYDLLKAGRAASLVIGYAYGADSVDDIMDAQCGRDIVAIPLCETLLTPVNMFWSIAYSSENPDAAAKVLNMMFTDEKVLNYIIFGVEGTDYVMSDVVDGIQTIKYPEGFDMSSVPYTAAYSCGIVGNQFIMYALEGNTKPEDVAFMKEMTDQAKFSPIYGFNPDTSAIKTQVSAVGNVVSQYKSGLLTGELDPEEYLPRFLEDLESAGIEEVVTEIQNQLDAWK